MQRLLGDGDGRLRLREAEAVYRDERARASRRPTFLLLRQERRWARTDGPSDAEQVRLNAVRHELGVRGVVVGGRSC